MSWYCQKVTKGKELSSRDSVVELGFNAYVPRCRPDKRKARDIRHGWDKPIPIFPGYLFVELEEGKDNFSLAKSPKNVHSYVTMPRKDGNKYPAPVHPSIIEALKARESDEGLFVVQNDYKVGNVIRFLSGPFKGYTATVTGTAREKVETLISMFYGRDIKFATEYFRVELA